MHWSSYYREKKAWGWHILAELKGKPPAASERMRLRITSYRKNLLDQDNLAGGCKPLIDAIKDLKLLVDDGPEWVEVEFEQVKIKDHLEHTMIEIEPIE